MIASNRWVQATLVAMAVAGCKFNVEAGGNVDGAISDAASDAVGADASTCTMASVECVADVLRTCTGPGAAAVDQPCTWSCIPGATPHCGVLVPAGGAVDSNDLAGTGDLTVNSAVVINGSAGEIAGSGWPDFELDNTANVAIFRFRNLTINAEVLLGGTHAIALVASGTVTINALIDGRPAGCVQPAAGPGGFLGGVVSTNGQGPGAGEGGGSNDEGAGGGGHGAIGGDGGAETGNAAGGVAYGDAIITQLLGGSGGGGGGDGGGPVGGGGGAAIQIVANGPIVINANGAINAGGCGGKNAGGADSGGGGGAGGTILLEATQVTIMGSLAVNGGGGGAGGGGEAGQSGQLGRTPAMGGAGGANGGSGGAGATPEGVIGSFNSGTDRGGGGGGGVGRIRVNTRTGAATIEPSAVLSPAFTDAPSTATQGQVNLQ